MAVTIYHNPRCAKSRETLALLEARGARPKIVLYMDDPFDASALAVLLKKLKRKPSELIRKKEALFRELDLAGADEAALLAAMASHPKLIERPIVVNGARAALGRPPEAVLDVL